MNPEIFYYAAVFFFGLALGVALNYYTTKRLFAKEPQSKIVWEIIMKDLDKDANKK